VVIPVDDEEWPDEEDERGSSCIPPFDPANPGAPRKPRVLRAQCATCIYRPGNPMRLRPGRLREMTLQALRQGCQGVICHDTLYRSDGFLPALCRGFYDLYGPRNNFIRVMWRIGGFAEVDLPPGEDSTSEPAATT
jgi:hypothetical protein